MRQKVSIKSQQSIRLIDLLSMSKLITSLLEFSSSLMENGKNVALTSVLNKILCVLK